MATTADITSILAHLQQPQPLSILKLSGPILHPKDDSTTPITPSALAADLAHYRDLFSKLRFSYVEQVTKERFLRTICAEQPEFATAAENAELQTRLLTDKAQLKEKKTEVAEMIQALEAQGRELAKRRSYSVLTRVGKKREIVRDAEWLSTEQQQKRRRPKVATPCSHNFSYPEPKHANHSPLLTKQGTNNSPCKLRTSPPSLPKSPP
jgi:hypothetical protein